MRSVLGFSADGSDDYSRNEHRSPVKAALPDLPVVFGGWHPTPTAEQSLQNDLVDVVVRGPGKFTLLETAQRYQSGEGLDGVTGLSYKRKGTIIDNLERPVARPMDLPVPAFTWRTSTHTSASRALGR